MKHSLFVRIEANEPGAIEECLDRFGALIWSLTRRHSLDRTDADELVQEIFIELWRHAHRFDEGVASESTFVMMIARRRLIDFRRKRQRTVSTSPLSHDLHDRELSAEDLLCRNEDADWAREQILRLPPIERKVLTMAIEEGLSHSKIAGLLSIPLGTVKTTARRGLVRLRALFRSVPHDRLECFPTDELATDTVMSHGGCNTRLDRQCMAE